ncbi:MAG: nuclear transport factor 2 family protein [Polyangiaceae bacterium]
MKEVANKLVAYCKEGKNLECVDELYGEGIESVEAAAMGDQGRTQKGIEAIRGKNKWWVENHEVHSANVEGPWPHGDEKFAVRFTYDVTNKPSGNRMKMDEIAVYTVDGGKIVKEEFFYDMG